MAEFVNCIGTILDHEKGYVEDSGGPTNWGVTLATLKKLGNRSLDDLEFCDINHDGVIDIEDIRALDREKAAPFYKRYWWDVEEYWRIKDDRMATKVFDLAVNMGPIQAHKLVQRALNRIGHLDPPLVIDGILGPKTFGALNALWNRRWMFLREIREVSAEFYLMLVRRDPDTFSEYRDGWLNRAYD